jgi:hypothetical protein
MVGTSMLHGICGKGDIFETEMDAMDCAKNNVLFKVFAGVIVGIILLIIGMMFLGGMVHPENTKKLGLFLFTAGFAAMYLNSHLFPFGPVRQYYADRQDIEDRLRHPDLMGKENLSEADKAKHLEDIRFAKKDLIKDRKAEQSALNQGKRQGWSSVGRSRRNTIGVGGINFSLG